MGLDFGCECQKCGYTFYASVGSGIAYPKVYKETVEKLKTGFYGAQGKEFFEAFPDGAISCERIVVQCNDCNSLMEVLDLSLYVPKDGFSKEKLDRTVPWSSGFSGKGYECITEFELRENYELFEKYDHRCAKCNGHTTVVPGFTENMSNKINRKVRCPGCGTILEIELCGMWD